MFVLCIPKTSLRKLICERTCRTVRKMARLKAGITIVQPLTGRLLSCFLSRGQYPSNNQSKSLGIKFLADSSDSDKGCMKLSWPFDMIERSHPRGISCNSQSIALFGHRRFSRLNRRREEMPPKTRATAARPTVSSTTGSTTGSKGVEEFYAETGARLLVPSLFRVRSPYDREIGALFLPALIALLLEPLQQFIDTIIVGRLGVPQLGALGLGTVLFQFALGFFASLVFATTPRIAACAAKRDLHQASKQTAQAMWIALFCGFALQAFIYAKAPDIINFMSSDLFVGGYTLSYLRARSFGFPGALIMMVAIGASRGLKEMNTPLLGSAAYLIALTCLDVLFVTGLGWGMEGAGWAASAAQWTGAGVVTLLLARRGAFRLTDMFDIPKLEAVVPYSKMTVSLGINNISALAPILVATSLATNLGAPELAAHTILRQLTGFWLQGFIALNATAHSLVATDLSRGRADGAGRVLVRCAHLAVIGSLPACLALWTARETLPGLFTADSGVIDDVAVVLPFLLLCMPLDALGTALEGGILGAADTRWIASRTVASSCLSLLALFAVDSGQTDLASVWMGLKVLNLAALSFDLFKFSGPVLTGVRKTVKGRKY